MQGPAIADALVCNDQLMPRPKHAPMVSMIVREIFRQNVAIKIIKRVHIMGTRVIAILRSIRTLVIKHLCAVFTDQYTVFILSALHPLFDGQRGRGQQNA